MAFFFLLLYLILNYLRPYEFSPGLARFRPMMVVGSIGLLASIVSIPISGFTFRAKQLPLVIGFGLWTAASLILARQWFGGALTALNEFGITLAAFFMATFTLTTVKRIRITVGLLVALSMILVFQDVLALRFGILRDLLILEQALPGGRIALRARGLGFMADPNDLAQTLVLAIPFAMLAWRPRAALRNFLFAIIPTAILLYGVYLTGSRGALVSLFVVVFIAIRSKLGAMLSGLMLAGGVLGLLAVSFGGRAFGLDESAINRIEAWSVGLQLLKQHPLTGVGYGLFTDFNRLTAHNSFVLCFSELGLPGYFLWVSLLLVTVLELNAIRKLPVKTEADATFQRLARSIQISLYGFLAAAWFLSRTYVVTLYLLIAFSMAVVEIARRGGKTVGPFSFPFLATRSVLLMLASIVLLYLQVRVQIR
jgi:hypothetical protein